MSLWDWAVEVYGRPGVSDAMLALQDDHGQNISYLLWAVWAGADDPVLLGLGAELARSWGVKVLDPLRGVRRALKPPFPAVGDTLREDVKAAELQAERVLMAALAALGGARGPASPLDALRAAVRAWGAPVPEGAVRDLAARLH